MKPGSKLTLAKTYDYCAREEPKLTVVMIHGIASDSKTYEHSLKYFAENESLRDVRFVAFDLLGSGESYAGDELDYDYDDQLTALHNSIQELDIKTPLVLVGHSLGTFIVTRYAHTYTDEVAGLILISPPIYTVEDLENPAFEAGIKAFEEVVSAKNPVILQEKAFKNSMVNIVLDKKNYSVLAGVKVPAVLVYGGEDQFIAAYNIPKLTAEKSQIEAIKTEGRHGVTRDKYVEVGRVLEKILHA